jgi:hypothetical protein
VLGIGTAVVGVSTAAGGFASLEDLGSVAGMGIGLIVFMVLFYGAYIVLFLAQQAAIVTLASPLEEPLFGAAMGRGFKSALPFFGIAVVLMLAYFAFIALLALVVGAVGLGGGAAAAVVGGLLALIALPVLIFVGCRLAVLVPVVAVDQVFHPITAIRRSWNVTRGRVVGILLAALAFLVLTLVVFGAPFALLFAIMDASVGSSGASPALLLLPLLLLPVLVIYSIYSSAYIAALHSEVTGGGAESLEEVFA